MRKALMRRIYAMAMAYLSQVLIALCGLAFPFMLSRFWKYEAVFYCLLLGLSFITFPVHRSTISLRRTILNGAIIGYVAALLSLSFTPLLEGEHFHDLLHGWSIIAMDFILMPVITLCWLVGICFGLSLLIQERLIVSRQTANLAGQVNALES